MSDRPLLDRLLAFAYYWAQSAIKCFFFRVTQLFSPRLFNGEIQWRAHTLELIESRFERRTILSPFQIVSTQVVDRILHTSISDSRRRWCSLQAFIISCSATQCRVNWQFSFVRRSKLTEAATRHWNGKSVPVGISPFLFQPNRSIQSKRLNGLSSERVHYLL